jgi:hypothetical protein
VLVLVKEKKIKREREREREVMSLLKRHRRNGQQQRKGNAELESLTTELSIRIIVATILCTNTG